MVLSSQTASKQAKSHFYYPDNRFLMSGKLRLSSGELRLFSWELRLSSRELTLVSWEHYLSSWELRLSSWELTLVSNIVPRTINNLFLSSRKEFLPPENLLDKQVFLKIQKFFDKTCFQTFCITFNEQHFPTNERSIFAIEIFIPLTTV